LAASNDLLRADGTGAEETLLDLPRAISELVPTRDTSTWIVRLINNPRRDIALWKRGDKDATLLIADLIASESQPSLSPDGRRLAYVSNELGRPEVYVRPFPNVDGGRWQISRNEGREPRW
jgi:Tol biopolymer transport system component